MKSNCLDLKSAQLKNALYALCFVIASLGLTAGKAESAELIYFDQPPSANLLEQSQEKRNFWPLVRYFISEKIDTYCGIASSIMVLNALEVPSPVSLYTYPY